MSAASTTPHGPAAAHREAADHFGRLVSGVRDWDAPSPVAGWTARDVVDHLVTWLPGLLGPVVTLAPGPGVTDDPAAAWRHHAAAVQGLLEDPASAALVLADPHIGELPVPVAVDRFYTSDVFLHAWDLARASDQDPGMDEQRCAEILAGMEPMEEMLRASGQFGERQPVAADAPAADRLMAFLGRDPDWRP
ncbi:MAG TPA: TIGR03086 family metal-binding protein [Nocardioides sp.]